MAGLALLPTAAVTMVAVGLAGRLAPRYGNRRLTLLWLCLAAMGLALWAVTGSGSPYLVLAVRSAGSSLRWVSVVCNSVQYWCTSSLLSWAFRRRAVNRATSPRCHDRR